MPERRIATVVLLDIVASTEIAAQLGDVRYRELSSRFARSVRAGIKRFGGREEDNAGDGFFATFPEPDRAIRFATTLADEIRASGIEIRSGIHTGQTEQQDGKAQGIAVVIGARVMSLAGPGEVLVTNTTKELVTGSGFGFEDFSAHELKGVPGTWHVFAVTSVDDQERDPPLRAEEAARRLSSIEPRQLHERRRRAALAVGGLGALFAIVAVVFAVTRPGDERLVSESNAPLAESIVQVDPNTGEVLDEVPAPVPQQGLAGLQRGTPDHAMAIGQGAVWTLRSYRWLYHVDARTHELGQVVTLETPNSFSVNMAAGLDEVWVAYDQGLIEVDPATQDQRVVLPLPNEDKPSSSDVAIGEGYVWVVTTQGLLFRYDPDTGGSREFSVGGIPDAIGVGHGSIWVGDAFAGTVTRLDATSLRREALIPIPQGVDNIVIGDEVWVLSETLHALTRIDPATDRVGPSVPIGDSPTGLTAGDGSVWVGDEDGVIRRINEATRQVTELRFGAAIRALAYDADSETLWVDVA